MKIKIISNCLLLAFLLSACNKWIDVKPSDRLTENQLFTNREGFQIALNGVYVELTNPDIYGENMSVSSLDVMGQHYFMSVSTHRYFDFATFAHSTDRARATFDNMWKKAYELIVNCNIIIKQAGDSSNSVLTGPYFGLIKGEALALRAMLHFDMLRLFGPIWTDADKGRPCIPYNKLDQPRTSELLSSEAVIQNILNDLTEAVALLEASDPIRTEGVRGSANTTGNNDFYLRQYRLNYFAVKALLARAYLWKADKEQAFKEATDLLTEGLNPSRPIFKIGVTNPNAVIADFDHLIVPEVLFSLYTLNRRDKIYNTLFSPEVVKERRLSFNNYDDNEGRKNGLYDDQNDYRLKSWMIQTNTSGKYLTHVKYDVTSNSPGAYMMPLIRLGEILLIAAECAPTLEEGTTYLNRLRTGRNVVSLAPTSSAQLKDFITREFRKETIGEGQTFFYFKRNAMTTIPNHANLTGSKTVTLPVYVVPLPPSEIAVRIN